MGNKQENLGILILDQNCNGYCEIISMIGVGM